MPPVTYKESVDDAVKQSAEIKRDELTESEAVSMIREQVSQGDKNATITIQNKTIIKSDTWRSIMLELLKKDAKLTLIVDNVEEMLSNQDFILIRGKHSVLTGIYGSK